VPDRVDDEMAGKRDSLDAQPRFVEARSTASLSRLEATLNASMLSTMRIEERNACLDRHYSGRQKWAIFRKSDRTKAGMLKWIEQEFPDRAKLGLVFSDLKHLDRKRPLDPTFIF
jgi:hypothetical protein